MSSYYSNWNMDFAYWRNRQEYTAEVREAHEYVSQYIAEYNRNNPSSRIGQEASLYYTDNWDEYTRDGYQNKTELNRWLDKFDNWVSKIDMGGVFKKQRLVITADNRGVFSFGLASKGLYIPKEFFSDQLALESPDEFADMEKPSGIVPALFVVKRDILGTEMFFYHSDKMNKDYEVFAQDEGTRAIQLGLPDAKIIYKTNVKKAYVMFPKKGGKAKMVDLYVPKNWGIKLANIMPTLMIAHFMRLYGVMCRINVLRVYEQGRTISGFSFMVKDFGDETDFDYVTCQTTNENTWRALVYGSQNLLEARRYGRQFNDKTNLTSIREQGDFPTSPSKWQEYMARFRNYYQGLINKGQIDPIRIDKKLMLLGYAFDTTEQGIFNEFYRLLDIIDLQFNKMHELLPRIYKRYVTEQGNSELEYKNYIIRLLQDTYRYPEGGDYAESVEDAKKLDDEYFEKLDELEKYIS